ncbi:MAG: DUF1272 domain-containing protein [Pseudohongiellaceae bacterium]
MGIGLNCSTTPEHRAQTKPQSERCDKDLPPKTGDACICRYECAPSTHR